MQSQPMGQSTWTTWWNTLSTKQKALPFVFITAWWFYLLLISDGQLKSSDYMRVSIFWFLIILLNCLGPRSRRLMLYLWPLTLVAVAYDGFRYWLKDFISGRVLVSPPYLFEREYFSISTADGVQTLNEFFRIHHHWSLDLITGITYALYIFGVVIICAWITLKSGKTGTDKRDAAYITERSPLITWSFWPVNTLGHLTWMTFPAAPPWYIHKYGLGPANMDEVGDAAGLLRFDQLLNIQYFQNFYAQTTAPFGAIPSLHCAYAVITVYWAFRMGSLRVASTLFFILMCFSAVYLDHHYLIDVILGALYGWLGCALTDWFYNKYLRHRKPFEIQRG